MVDEIWNETEGYFNANTLSSLLQYITGNEDITASDVASTKINQTRTSADIRTSTANGKTTSQDVQVTFGGLTWQVVHLTQDKIGNDIVTLWLSNNYQQAWEGRSATEGTYYGFIDGALYSDWSADWYSSTYSSPYPSNMYGTSYIRAATLNNGGNYATSVTALTTTPAQQSADSVFAIYTMEDVAGSVKQYIVTPSEVAWQETENAYAQDCSYTYSNDAYSTPAGTTNWYSSNYNYTSKTNYADWINDSLWLPSMAEAGNGTDGTGLWEVSSYQRANNSGSTSSIGAVGSSDMNYGIYVYNSSWLRSGYHNNAYYAYSLAASGSGSSDNHVNLSYAVRPALHLNLNSAALTTDPTIWNGSKIEAPSLEDPAQANSEDNPYIIDTAAKLAWISANFDQSNCYGQYYLQTVNIDLASHPWTPINNVSDTSSSNQRAYYYDGGEHTVSNLYINTSEQTLTSNKYLGLFGFVNGSSSNHCYIKNLGIVNGSIAGESSNNVGAVVGRAWYTDITNCYNEKTDITITGSSNYVGGVVGQNQGTISGSYNTGTVSGERYIGGVVGLNNEGTISSSYNTGIVSGAEQVGGVSGINYATISGSYNTGAVSGSREVGGVAGRNIYGTISGSYNTGTVSGSREVGGVVGLNYETISDSYNYGDITGLSSSVGGVVGQNQGTISGSYNTRAVSGSSYVGGVAGYNYYGIISSSYNTGAVSGSSYVGGVAGGNSGTISGSYNTGSVSGSSWYVGGVVGYAAGSSSSPAVISSCFSTGAVTRTSGSDTTFGGVVGHISNSGSYLAKYVSVAWCYYNTETVGSVVTKAIGEGSGYQVYGLTTAQMQGDKNQNYMYLSDTFWNFASGQYPTLKYVAKAPDDNNHSGGAS